jgi:spore germination protein YaaH
MPWARVAALTLALALPLAVLPLGGTAVAAPAASSSSKVFLGYWAKWGTDQSPNASLSANLNRIDLYSPYWYTLRSDGTLSSRESGHATLTATVQAKGHKVIPLINKTSSNTPLLDPTTRRKAVANIYQMLVNNGFDGVNIDFEGMPPSTRAGVTAFMRELSAKLRPAGLLVTMAVPAKWSADESTNSFAACFDFAALGQVVDYLVIMTYDQHGGWSGPGPVAGADWTEKVIRYATSVVPAGKILLGLAGYGYDWSAAGVTSISAASAPVRAAGYGARIIWDSKAQVPHFTYWRWGTRHDVWYENSYSVEFKIAQVNRYNLGGVALWALGMEDARFWQVIAGTIGWTGGLGAASRSASGTAW